MMQQKRRLLIQNRLGLHARAAVKLVELAQSYKAVLTIENHEGAHATADSVMELLMLESAQGQYITVKAQGVDAELALEAICSLIEDKFNEDE